MLKRFLANLPKNALVTTSAYVLFAGIGLLATAMPENAGELLGLAMTGIASVLAIDLFTRALREKHLRSELDALTEQHCLLSEDVARWHRRANQTGKIAVAAANDVPKKAETVTTATKVAPKTAPVARNISFDEATIRSLLQNAIRSERLDIVVQPVMRLPQRRPAMLEIHARLPSGQKGMNIAAGRFMSHLREARKVPVMDRLVLQYCFNLMTDPARQAHDLPYILNIQADTFRDSAYMTRLLTYLRGNQGLAQRLIFEMGQADYQQMNEQVRGIIGALSGLGCRFSMDNVTNPQFTRSYLQDNHISFVKLSGARLAQMSRSETGIDTVQRIKDNLARHGVALVAENIEEEHTLMDILDLGLDYGQGFLFGQPVAPVIQTKETYAA